MTEKPTYHFDLSGFLNRLSNDGFHIGVDTHILIQKIIAYLPSNYEPKQLKTLLMPIVCKSQNQQIYFLKHFENFINDDYKKQNVKESSDNQKEKFLQEGEALEIENKVAMVFWIIGIILLFIIIGVSFYIVLIEQINVTNQVEQVEELKPSDTDFFEKKNNFFIHNNKPLLIYTLLFLYTLIEIVTIFYSKKKDDLVAKQHHNTVPDLVHKLYLNLNSINFTDTLKKTIIRLRTREPLGIIHLDLKRTIKASINNLGFFSARYKEHTQYTEYLILIKADNINDHSAQLYNTFYEELLYHNIPAKRYFFRTSPQFCYNEQGEEIKLTTILDVNTHCVLLVFAELNTFISLKSKKTFDWLGKFTNLPQRYLLLPFGTTIEAILAQPLKGVFDAVLPATELGFEQLEKYINQGKNKDNFTRYIRLHQTVPTFPIRIEMKNELMELEKLFPEENRNLLLKWIAACAIYPDFSWKMTLFLGELLS
ncbi:MAG: hypothetical protein AB8G11_20690, partial [Saprospiraceae bacterium]